MYGGAFDPEFEDDSLPLFDQIRSGIYQLAISPFIETEIAGAPARVLDLYRSLRGKARWLELNQDIRVLYDGYLKHGIVGEFHYMDAYHVASATVGGCLAIVSWNFKHIVHVDKIPLYNAVNRLHGYNDIAIHTPSEVLRYE